MIVSAAPRHSALVAPSVLWPNETCAELGGAGWRVVVLCVRENSALVAFSMATDARGRQFEPVLLRVSDLRKL